MTCLPIWTPEELSSNLTSLRGQEVWRMVEAQHQIATLPLVDSLADQDILEDILEDFKPPMPADTAGLHYLLATPFRYKAVDGAAATDKGSRFRSSGSSDGVFYCGELPAVCAYEMAFYRALFYAESPNLPYPAGGLSLSAFSTTISSDRVLDLTTHKTLSAYASVWENPADYTLCQKLAEDARAAGIEVIIYKSVRDPVGRKNFAVLSPKAFNSRQIENQQTWTCVLSDKAIYMLCECPRTSLEISRSDLEKDPRFKQAAAAAA